MSMVRRIFSWSSPKRGEVRLDRPIGWHLFLLVLGALLPILSFAGLTTWRYAEAERGRIVADAANSTREIAAGLDIALADLIATAQVLAGADTLIMGDLAAFHQRATQAAPLLRGVVVVRDAASRQLLNTVVSWGAPLPDGTNLAAEDADVARTGRPVVSSGFVGLADSFLQFAVVLPLSPREGPARFLSVSNSAARVQQILDSVSTLAPRVIGGVTDQNGLFLAHSTEPARWVGRPAPLRRLAKEPQTEIDGSDTISMDTHFFMQSTTIAGWNVVVWVPRALMRDPLVKAARQTATLGATAFMLALLAGWLGARRIGGAVAALTDAAAELEQEGLVAPLATPVREVNRVGAVISSAAVKRQAREIALRKSEEHLRLATTGAGAGTWEIDLATGRGRWSQEAAALLGIHQLESATEEWVEALHPDDRAGAMQSWRRAIVEGIPYESTFRAARPSREGNERWLLSRGREERGADGHPVRVLGVLFDITMRKEAEAVLTRGKEELERLVDERTRDLREAQARLAHAQRIEALGQLAGGIAHDFNNVLQIVGGGAQLIEARAEDTGRVRRLAAMLGEAAARGGSITRRLLAFSRRADLHAEPIDAEELLRGTAEVLSHTLGAGIALHVEATPDLPWLFADKGQLETVLVNLASNARDAMAGSGTITLRAEAAVVGLGDSAAPFGLQPGTYLRLSMMDTGTGMPAEVLARATEPFFTTKERGKGTGLGLAMARGFVEQSGGALEIQSAPGCGTIVSVWLPMTSGKSALPPPPPAPIARKQARVLLADDEADVLAVTGEGLRDAGFAVTAVGSAQEALDLLDLGENVDIIVSDLSMPGVDGLTLIREAQRRRQDLPAILLTGFVTDAADIVVGRAVPGSFLLLRKPIEARALAERIGMLLRDDQESAVQSDRGRQLPPSLGQDL